MFFRYRILPVVLSLLLVCLCACRSSKSAMHSRVRATGSSEASYLNHTVQADTSVVRTISQSNGYIVITETQTITEYDTSQPNRPVSKTTTTQKHTRKGTLSQTSQSAHAARSGQSHTYQDQNISGEMSADTSQTASSTPVVQSTVRWYVAGGIVIAVLSLVTALVIRRKQKARTHS